MFIKHDADLLSVMFALNFVVGMILLFSKKNHPLISKIFVIGILILVIRVTRDLLIDYAADSAGFFYVYTVQAVDYFIYSMAIMVILGILIAEYSKKTNLFILPFAAAAIYFYKDGLFTFSLITGLISLGVYKIYLKVFKKEKKLIKN